MNGKTYTQHPRWPLPPRCPCGAVPGSTSPMCSLAAQEGRDAKDAAAENCPRWLDHATAVNHLAPQ